MNKKFLSAILFGALMVTSTGTFVSCKDYDEDIENLQSQINNLATKSDVEAKLSQLQAAIDAAKAESAANASKLAALEKCECDVDAMLAKVKESVDADMAAYKTELEALIAQAEALVGEIADFVTSVELNFEGRNRWYALDFYSVREKANVFEDGLTGALTFEANKQTQEGMTPVIVRVNPTNAVLAPEMISLVNSKGENLDEYVSFKVEKYTDLLSRAATNNGLWKITPVLKEYDKDQYAAMKYVKVAENTFEKIQYAIQVNNAIESAEARYATSEYAITLGDWTEFVGANGLCFTVDGVSVLNINNRFDATSKSLPNYSDASKTMYKEWVWRNKTNSAEYGPAATEKVEKDDPNTTDVDELNVAPAWDMAPDGWWSVGDNRSELPAALAVQGKKMTITIDDNIKDNDENYESKIAGLYVTLDYKANAVESEPSEWNAWNEYEITGLNTVVEGTSIEITIDDETTINDYIGFRVYAVNLDGTLVDPDGRAFYVLVGKQAAEAQTIAATITPVNDVDKNFASHKSVTVDLTAAQSEVITSLLNNQKNNPTVVMDDENNPNKYEVDYTVKFNLNKKGDAYVSATFELADGEIADLINDKTYKASIVYKNANGHELGTVNFELTKVMPTAFPTDFAFLPKQETEDGSGKFVAYMIPENGYEVATASEAGLKDLDDIFYGLDDYYKFEFATSALNSDEEIVSVKDIKANTAANAEYYYQLKVAKSFINNETWHAVSVWYTYPGISTYSYTDANGDEAWAHGVAHEVAYTESIEAKYACWEDASAFAWGTYKKDDATLSRKPALQWTADGDGAKVSLSYIASTNSYDNTRFGKDLETLVITKGWLTVTDIKLTVGEQVNPYFKPEVKDSEIIFTQVTQQVEAAPTADHEETLTMVVEDAYGHKTTITLDVTVKAPEKK